MRLSVSVSTLPRRDLSDVLGLTAETFAHRVDVATERPLPRAEVGAPSLSLANATWPGAEPPLSPALTVPPTGSLILPMRLSAENLHRTCQYHRLILGGRRERPP
jgi:hypothetical protein